MGSSSGGTGMIPYAVFGVVLVASSGCWAGGLASGGPTKTCNSGWMLCPTTRNHCVPRECLWEQDSGGRCGEGLSLCEPEDACFKPCPLPSGRTSPGKIVHRLNCPPGKTFCVKSGKCTSTMECDGDGRSGSRRGEGEVCGLGFTFCASRGGCVWGRCSDEGDQAPTISCPPGTVLCTATGTCVGEGNCAHDAARDGGVCLPGQVWCLASGRCVADGECESSPTVQASICGPDEEYCLQRGSCVTRGGCESIGTISSLPVTSCGPGEEFCLQRGSCVPLGSCDISVGAFNTAATSCGPGEEFCLQRGSCVALGSCDTREGVSSLPATSCSPHQEFCLQRGSCVTKGTCESSKADGEEQFPICLPGQVFCLATGTCEEAGGCDGRPAMSGKMCPRGFIYCLQRGECVHASRGCSDTSPVMKPCPEGTVFSILSGSCIPDPTSAELDGLPSLQCPASPSNDDTRLEFSFTSCISDAHCPYGRSCCPDEVTLHLQCVDSDGKTDDSSLQMACVALDSPQHDTGLNCSRPSQCPPTSVCCQGTCRSRKGVDSCPLSTLYCPVTGKCAWLGQECGKVCAPRTVYCATNNSCEPKGRCESTMEEEIPWTMPSIKRTSFSSSHNTDNPESEGVMLSQTFRGAPTAPGDRLSVKYEVVNVTTWNGRWAFRNYYDDIWTTVMAESPLESSSYIRYTLHNRSYSFGLDYIKMKELGTDINRYVVQLVAPESPAIHLISVVSNISMTEDETRVFRLRDLVNLTCDDDRYWGAWKNAVATDLATKAAKLGFLDYSSDMVRQWVKLLQHPQLPVFQEEMDNGGCGWEDDGLETRNDMMNGQERVIQYFQGRRGRNTGHEKKNKPNNGKRGTGDKERGLWLEWAEKPGLSEDTVNVYYMNKFKKWRTMNLAEGYKFPVVSCEAVKNTLLRIRPAPNFHGIAKFSLAVYPDRDTRTSNVFNVTVEVESINDVPVTLAIPDRSRVPSERYGQPSTGTPVSEYLNAYYYDPDGASLKSMLLLYASGGQLGEFQYSLDGRVYTNVVLEDNPFPTGLEVSKFHQGAVPLKSKLEKMKCDVKSLIKNSNLASLAESDKCLHKSRKKLAVKRLQSETVIKKQNTEAGDSRGRRRRKRSAVERPEILRQYEGFGSQNLNLSFPVVTGLCLPSSALLKFSSSHQFWTEVEGIRNTRLVFLGGDASCSENDPLSMKWMNFSLAQNFEEEGRFAQDPVTTWIQMSDCTGQPIVIGPPRTLDACGVCGGDNSSCTDCAGVLNGAARWDICNECVGGTTNKAASTISTCIRNCSADTASCIPRSSTDVIGCDNTTQSNATLNDCGICVGGRTGLLKDEGKDKCNVCFGTDSCIGCDGVAYSGAVKDACGICGKPDDPEFNDCQVLQYIGDTLDAVVNEVPMDTLVYEAETEVNLLLAVEAKVIGLKAKAYQAVSCSLLYDEDEVSSATKVDFKKRIVTASFKDLLAGSPTFRCTFRPKQASEDAENVEVESRGPISVLNSGASYVKADVAEVETASDSMVTLTVNKTTPLKEASCILIYSDQPAASGVSSEASRQVVLPRTTLLGEGKVSCLIPKNSRPGQAQIGLVLTYTALRLIQMTSLPVPTKPLTIKASAPKVVSARLNSAGKVLRIKFDQNVESETECSEIVNWPWKDESRSPSPKCQFLASKLKVQLGSGIEIKPNSSLTFTDANGIRRAKGDSLTAPTATGTFLVTQKQSSAEITFRLTGATSVCNTSLVYAKVSQIRGIRISNVKAEWNITWEPVSNMDQADILSVWDSISKMKDSMMTITAARTFTLTVPGKLFLPGIEYLIVVHLENSNGESSEPQSLSVTTLPTSELIQVSIDGPTDVRVDVGYPYIAVTSTCFDSGEENLKLEYIWNVAGVGNVAALHQRGQRMKLPPYALRGGEVYRLSVVAMAAQDPSVIGVGHLEVRTLSQGIRVVTSADSFKIGSVSPVKIDASSSVDLDNQEGSLMYRWSCRTEEDLCYVNGQLLEEVLSYDQITSPTLEVPAALLPSGRYIFTVEVRKNRVAAEKDVEVEIVAGRCAVLETQPPADFLNPLKRIQVPTLITGPRNVSDLEVYWTAVEETGFEYIDISHLASGKVTVLKMSPEQREYDLVLPRPGKRGFPGLVGGVAYKFRIGVKMPRGVTCHSDIILRTNSLPADGIVQVEPTSGEALVTNFMFSAPGWTDLPTDLPLYYYFGYDTGEGPVVWSGPYFEEEPVVNLTLPLGNEEGKVKSLVRVCDVYKACAVKEGPIISLSLPDELPPSTLRSIVNNFENQMNYDDSVKSALGRATDQLKTLANMDDETGAAALKAIGENLISEKLSSFTASMNGDSASRENSQNILDGGRVWIAQTGASEELLDKMMTLVRLYVATIFGDDPDSESNPKRRGDRIIFPDDDEQRFNTGRNDLRAASFERGLKRTKRETQPANSTHQLSYVTASEVKSVLLAAEQVVAEGDAELDTSGIVKEIMQNISRYMSGLCRHMSLKEGAANEVLGNMVSLRVLKSSLTKLSDVKFPIATSNSSVTDFVMKDSYVTWGPVLSQYEEWSCGNKGAETEDKPCYGACIATALLKEDYLSSVKGTDPPGKLRTSVAKAALLNPLTSIEIPIKMEQDDKITYHLALNDDTLPEGYKFKCFGWEENEWDGRLCSTGKVDKGLQCFCKRPLYVAGFLIKDATGSRVPVTNIDESEDTTTTTATLTSTPPNTITMIDASHVKFIIPGDYDKIVGPNVTEFLAVTRTQLAERLGIPEGRIINMKVTNGSAIVEFDIVMDPTRSSSKTPAALRSELEDLIKSGGLVLLGPANQEIKVPPQALDGSGPIVEEKKDPTMLPIIIGSVVGGIVLIVLVFICVAIYLKNKKRMDKVQPLQVTDSKQPTYSSIHFDQAMDGTMASLLKHRGPTNLSNRSLSSGGSYSDEGIYIERRSTADSSQASSGPNSAGGSGSYDSGAGDEVPQAFRYRTPTKEELERSGPIPEHIDYDMRGLRLGHELPGKPDYLLRELPKWPDWRKSVERF